MSTKAKNITYCFFLLLLPSSITLGAGKFFTFSKKSKEEQELAKLEKEAKKKMKAKAYEEAIEIHQKAIEIAKKLPEKKKNLMALLKVKGVAHHILYQSKETIECLESLLALHLKDSPIEWEEVGSLYKQIADRWFTDEKNFEEAAKNYKKAVESLEKLKNNLKEPLVLFNAYVTWAYIFKDKKKYELAGNLYTKALTLRGEYPKKIKKIRTTNMYYLRAICYFKVGKYQESLESVQTALELEKKYHKEKSAKVAAMQELSSSLYLKLGEKEKAEKQQKEAYEIRKKVHGTANTLTKKSFQMLRTIKKTAPVPSGDGVPKSSNEEVPPSSTDDDHPSAEEELEENAPPTIEKKATSHKKWMYGLLPIFGLLGLTFSKKKSTTKEKNVEKPKKKSLKEKNQKPSVANSSKKN